MFKCVLSSQQLWLILWNQFSLDEKLMKQGTSWIMTSNQVIDGWEKHGIKGLFHGRFLFLKTSELVVS